MTVAADETRIYLTRFNTHDLAQINTGTLAVEQTFETGPNPTRVALGSDGNLITVLNEADTTVSLLNL